MPAIKKILISSDHIGLRIVVINNLFHPLKTISSLIDKPAASIFHLEICHIMTFAYITKSVLLSSLIYFLLETYSGGRVTTFSLRNPGLELKNI